MGDKLTSVSGGSLGSRSYTYDGDGQLTHVAINNAPAADFAFDYDGRLVEWVPYSGNSPATTPWTSNRYNGMGLRVQKVDTTGSFNFLTDGSGPGSPVLSDGAAVYTGGLSERRNGVSSFYADDLLGSLGVLTDSSGSTVTDRALFDAFGQPTSRTGSNPSPFQYCGRAGYQTDHDNGLMLLGNRFYDSSIGRFISRDPAGAGDNWYVYCDNNPVGMTDPLGLEGGGGSTSIGSNTLTAIAAGGALIANYGSKISHLIGNLFIDLQVIQVTLCKPA